MNRALPKRIFICGFMGAGKTTVGKLLAEKLHQPFHDLDACIEKYAGESILEIFKHQGEKKFRKTERTVLLDVIRDKKGIIALGGGTLQNQHLVDHIKVNGLLVFIDAKIEIIMERIAEEGNRPKLMDESGSIKPKDELKEDLQALYNKRLPFYEQAEVTIQTADYNLSEELTEELVKKIKYHVALY